VAAEIELGPETESTQGWAYEGTRVFDQGRLHTLSVHLSFADYDHWSRGAHPPSRVAERAIAIALTHLAPNDLSDRIDCSTLRRRIQGIDEAMQAPQ